MQRFKYEDNELLPILQAGDLITVNGSPVEKKIKQDERVEQTKSMAEEEGIYFY